MTTPIVADPAGPLAALADLFHLSLDNLRPGARYVMSVTDEVMMLAFCDHGGSLMNSTLRMSSGPLHPHASNPDWTPPTWDPVNIRISGETGDVSEQVPPILWLPGPGMRRIELEEPRRQIGDGETIEVEGR